MIPSDIAAPRTASWLLFVTVALAPLPFGSVEPAATAFWCIVLGLCLVLAPVRGLGRGDFALAGLAALVAFAYAVVLHEQLAEHPWFATPDPIWEQAKTALEAPLTPSVAIAKNQPWFALGRPLVCLMAVACGFLVGHDGGRARRLLKIIAWSGAIYAAYGIMMHLFDPTHILGREKQYYLESVTGTFINRNTAGAYFGSCATVWSLLLWERLRRELPRSPIDWRAAMSRLSSAQPKKALVPFAMLFLCLAAMFMTRSRGAVLVSLLALIVAFTAYFRRDLPRRGGLLATLAAGCLAAMLLLQLMGEGVNSRFDLQGLADGGRLKAYKSTLRIIGDHPIFGTGQGTFEEVFPAYRSSDLSIWGRWDLAHSTLLEIAADMGVPIAALVAISWIVIFGVLLRGIMIRRGNLIVPVAALAVALLAVAHSLIDFSLQIPGYSIVVFSLVGAGLAESVRDSRDETARKAGELTV